MLSLAVSQVTDVSVNKLVQLLPFKIHHAYAIDTFADWISGRKWYTRHYLNVTLGISCQLHIKQNCKTTFLSNIWCPVASEDATGNLITRSLALKLRQEASVKTLESWLVMTTTFTHLTKAVILQCQKNVFHEIRQGWYGQALSLFIKSTMSSVGLHSFASLLRFRNCCSRNWAVPYIRRLRPLLHTN